MLKPKFAMIRGKRYRLCAAIVNVKDRDAPSNITILSPKHTVKLAGGEEFITLYLPDVVLPLDWESRT